jgi:hypothetical protein
MGGEFHTFVFLPQLKEHQSSSDRPYGGPQKVSDAVEEKKIYLAFFRNRTLISR